MRKFFSDFFDFKALLDYFQRWPRRFVADLRDPKKRPGYLKYGLIILGLFIVLYAIGARIPEGFDWINYYKQIRVHPVWTPWTKPMLRVIVPYGYGLVFALSMLGIGIRTYRYNKSLLPAILAFTALPTLWMFFMGNLDGLILFGWLIMPVGVPLVLMKPQIAAFSLLARKDWFIAGVVWFIITLLIWGFWPTNMLMVLTPAWKAEWTQDINIFPWGVLPALPLLWLSRGDQDLLMAAGSLATPHLFPYHFVILTPALGRMKWYWMVITWIVSWTPLLANWLGPNAWHFGNLMSLCFWFGIYLNSPRARSGEARAMFAKIKAWVVKGRMGRGLAG